MSDLAPGSARPPPVAMDAPLPHWTMMMVPATTDEIAPPLGRAAFRGVAILCAVAATAWVLYRLERLAFVLALAMFFAYLVAPLVRFAEQPVRIGGRPRQLSRGLAIALVYVVILGSAGGGAALLLPTVTDQFAKVAALAPADAEAMRVWAQGWSRYYQHSRLPPEVRDAVDRSVVQIGDAAAEYAHSSVVAAVGLASYVPWLVLVPILAFFFLKDADGFRRAAVLALPVGIRRRGYQLFAELNTTLAAYIRAQLLACLFVGCTCGIGFALLDVPYAALLGVLAGVLEFVPLVGPFAAAVVSAGVAALYAPLLAVWVTLFLGALRIVQDYVVYPRLIRHGIHLHPLAVIVAVLAGVELGGVAGIFVAIPIVAVVSVTSRHWFDWRANVEGLAAPTPGAPPFATPLSERLARTDSPSMAIASSPAPEPTR